MCGGSPRTKKRAVLANVPLALLGIKVHPPRAFALVKSKITCGKCSYLTQDRGLVRTEKRYDFNHQRLAPSEVKKISRTDQIFMTCEYDTSNDADPVHRGENTQMREMCVSQGLRFTSFQCVFPCQDTFEDDKRISGNFSTGF